METNNELTILDIEDNLIQRLAVATDPKEIEEISTAVARIHNSIAQQEKGIDELRLTSEIEEKKLEQEKKGNFWRILGGIGTALLGAAGVIGAQIVKGKMDQEYQDQGYAHEKTETVIWNRNKHRR